MVIKMAEEKVEKKVETAGKVEKKAENGKKRQNGKKKNGDLKQGILKALEEKLSAVDVTLDEIEELKEISDEMAELNAQMQEIMARRDELRKKAHGIMDKLDKDTRKLLEFLGLLDVKTVTSNLYGGNSSKKAGGQRAKRGNGLSGKAIVYEGQEYRQATYFMKKHGITGGLEGLKEWVENQGLTVRVEDDTIYIE